MAVSAALLVRKKSGGGGKIVFITFTTIIQMRALSVYGIVH
jgi:hypothetical protein